jgi:hypothetical protein
MTASQSMYAVYALGSGEVVIEMRPKGCGHDTGRLEQSSISSIPNRSSAV